MARLEVERAFSDPPLAVSLPQRLAANADGSIVTWLETAADNRERLDLWRFDTATGVRNLWIDGRRLDEGDVLSMSAHERAERERRRQFAHGVTHYEWSADGRFIVIPAAGAAHLLEVATGNLERVTPVGRHTDVRISPCSRYLGYVRERSLYVLDLATRGERLVAGSDDPAIACGVAEFVAQEEMHRYRGYWWRPDGNAIAFTRVDERGVSISHRYEIGAGTFEVVAQRYPFAGEPNARVELGVFDLTSGTTRWLDWCENADDYLARAEFNDDGVIVQVQSRAQDRLAIRLFDAVNGTATTLAIETSPTWINLNDNFTRIGPRDYLWTVDHSEGAALVRIGANGRQTVGTGAGRVNRIVRANGRSAVVTGWDEDPTQQHVFRVDLATGARDRLTDIAGWHDAEASADGGAVVVRGSALDRPGEIDLHMGGGTARIASAAIGPVHPYHPYLDTHVTPQLGSIRAADGQPLYYRLTRPRADGPVPLVVNVYGGPGVQRVRNEWPPLTLQLLAQAGFGVLELDNRGTTNRGRRFEAPIHRRLGRIEVEDQIAGTRFAAGLDWVDASSIAVMGHSYGGYVALMCMCAAPDLYRAGVATAPVTDWALYDTHYTERYLGDPRANAAGYEQSGVLAHLAGLGGRLLLMHGMADDNVLFTHTTLLMDALQRRNVAFELMAYPGSKHSLEGREVSIHRFNLILDFLRETPVTIAVRQALAADIDTIVAFNVAMAAESEGRGLRPEVLAKGLEWIIAHPHEGRILIAERAGERAGSAMVTFEWSEWRNGRFWWIQSVYVAPPHRRHGVYTALHDWIRSSARADPQGCGIRLYVEKDNNGARAAYLGLGMVVTSYDLMEEDFTRTER